MYNGPIQDYIQKIIDIEILKSNYLPNLTLV